ncbi:MAG: chaperone NapD [Desulfuromonadaceae bacterium]
MPIGGFVVNTLPEESREVAEHLDRMTGVEVHGSDKQGNIIAVIESETSDLMEDIVKEVEGLVNVLNVGAVYLHAEDEVEKIERGEIVPQRPFKKRKFKLA